MQMKNNNFFNDLEFQILSNEKLIHLLDSLSFFDRGRAITELARRSGQQVELLDLVVERILNYNNMKARTVGLVSVSHLGMAGLVEANTSLTLKIVKELIEKWPEPDRSDLLDFLESAYSVDIAFLQ